MNIAVLSGKGGTGKTTLAVNLAEAAGAVTLLDCDVEEPNSHLYFSPSSIVKESVTVEYPEISKESCTNCGACGRFCRFNAFITSPSLTLTLTELCHSCGGCAIVCPENAIIYREREIGIIKTGTCDALELSWGALNVGELSGVKIIEALRERRAEKQLNIIDCPPGTSCSTVAAVEDADFALIVAEPTPFGISDMQMVVEMLRNLECPMVVVVNKAGLGDRGIYTHCREQGIPIIGEIPFSREAAGISARGELLFNSSAHFSMMFTRLYEKLIETAERTLNGHA